MKWIIAAGGGLLLVVGGVLVYLSHSATPPEVGLRAGQLRPCPATPNCVSSESGTPPDSYVEPLPVVGARDEAWGALRRAIGAAGGTIVKEEAGYLWATFTTPLFRFVDDVECRMAEAEGVIHLRSASRVGRSDLGVNRKRVATLRRQYEQRRQAGAEGVETTPAD